MCSVTEALDQAVRTGQILYGGHTVVAKTEALRTTQDSGTHTQGKLSFARGADNMSGSDADGSFGTIRGGDDVWHIARVWADGPNPEGDARRLVACWNACDGMKTETLERLLAAKGGQQLAYVALERERDELRRANADLAKECVDVSGERDEAMLMLCRIAYDPWGPSDASASDVLELITEAARAFLKGK